MGLSKDFNPILQNSSFSIVNAPSLDRSNVSPIAPCACGIGLKPSYFDEIFSKKYDGDFNVDFFEVHTENYMAEGGNTLHNLDRIREEFPISLHGVGMSLGSAEGLDMGHLARVRRVMDRYNPIFISDHISFSVVDGSYLNDLLPLTYKHDSLKIISQNIRQMQDFLGRQILVENPSRYLSFVESDFTEVEFLNEIVNQTGCGLLIDINNIYVSAFNHGWDARHYIRSLNGQAVQEYHLAGHSDRSWQDDGHMKIIKIDDHGSNVCDGVWQLYRYVLEIIGERPSLIEWDQNIPSYFTLLQESKRARDYMQNIKEGAVGKAS